jgi:protein phosphatase 2C family protein 2/3
VHHRIDDDPDDIDMDLDARFRPNSGQGGRIILLGDGTEISTEAPDGDMFDHDDEDKDLESQVDKYNKEESNGNARNDREGTPGPSSKDSHPVTESPSSVQTEKSDNNENPLKEAAGDKKPLVDTTKTSEK